MFFKILLFTLTVAVFWWYGSVVLDPDFGWHLSIGEFIQTRGIPKTDPLSYTMPGYQFVDYEWLANSALSLLYPLIGFAGLSIIFAVFAAVALFLQIHSEKRFIIIPLVICATTLLSFAGVRPQVISWLFFSLLLYVTLDNKRLKTWAFVIPFIFLLWANIHGGFPLGLVSLAIIFIGRMLTRLKFQKDLTLILFLSILATLINPYGIKLWHEIWAITSDGALSGNIAEWMPMLFMPHLTFWYFFPFSVLFVIRYRNKFKSYEFFLFFVLLAAGLISRRHVPFFIILSLPLTIRSLNYLFEETTAIAGASGRLAKANIIFSILSFMVVAGQLFLQHRTMLSYTENAFYPKKAVAYLKNHKSQGNLCSVYNWGGYLIWKLPEKKVCIDGRMPAWKQKETAVESGNAFEEFQKLGAGDISLEHVATKYDIDTLLLPKLVKSDEKNLVTAISNIIQPLFHNTEKKRKYPSLETQLVKSNWIKAYEDVVAVIYIKQKDQHIFPPLTKKEK
ncbi:MAG: hypothetical protein HYT11_02225 [Candidatus Levybacteria bacterium]|nr:hypothetical protein [Candidatus Levybacteria bacterium]